jgi:hypothetical protein
MFILIVTLTVAAALVAGVAIDKIAPVRTMADEGGEV